MPRSALLLLLLLLAGGWFFISHYQFEGFDQIHVRRRDAATGDPQEASSPSYTRASDVIRVATLNLDAFDDVKARKPHVMRILTDMVRRFDVVAIQGIRTASQRLLPVWVDQINADGHAYQYVLGPRQGRPGNRQQYAFLLDSSSVQVDRNACFTVGDPHHLMLRPPLVGSFRVRGVPPDEAFTFLLINVHTNPDAVDAELDALAEVCRAVRQASQGEDDIILLGDLNTDDRHLRAIGEIADVRCAVAGVATNTRGTRELDNLIFRARSTTEFTDRAGVFDVMREFNLTMAQTLEIADHLPVWAEFAAIERGPSGTIAAQPDDQRR
jgi:deoxyribonuclease-1-like protein